MADEEFLHRASAYVSDRDIATADCLIGASNGN